MDFIECVYVVDNKSRFHSFLVFFTRESFNADLRLTLFVQNSDKFLTLQKVIFFLGEKIQQYILNHPVWL